MRIWSLEDWVFKLELLDKWPRRCLRTILCLLSKRDLVLFNKDSILNDEDSISVLIRIDLDPKIIFASFDWLFTPVSGLIMPKMTMHEWLYIFIYDFFLMNQWIMTKTILPKIWRCMLMIFIFLLFILQFFPFPVR